MADIGLLNWWDYLVDLTLGMKADLLGKGYSIEVES